MPERMQTQMRFSLCPPAPKGAEPFHLRKGNAFGEKAAYFRKKQQHFKCLFCSGVATHSTICAAAAKWEKIALVSGSGADAETHAKAFPNGTASND